MTTSLNGGVVKVTTTVDPAPGVVYSRQYIEVSSLESRPTEWIPGGRPIYRRLPSTSETYQVNFYEDGEVGFVYVPWGEGIFGAQSLEVIATDSQTGVLIKPGTILWKVGRSEVNPVLIDLQDLQVTSGRYFLGYELSFNDEEKPFQYEVTSYSLSGLPLTITASTDSVFGWRFPASNAFVPEEDLIWKNFDTRLPGYVQPSTSYLRWQSDTSAALETVRVNLPKGTIIPSGVRATMSYNVGSSWSFASSAGLSSTADGSFFEFNLDTPTFQNGWEISWESEDGTPFLEISVDGIYVSGVITLNRKPSAPVPGAALVMYPENQVPRENVYCALATVDVDSNYRVTEIEDIRSIVHRDYVPVADWITRPWDENLINLYEQVSDYAALWLSPQSCLNFEYETLTKYGIKVN
jgi:hypothetical protein